MQSDFIHGTTLYKPIVGESINPRSAQSREARREIARKEAVTARFEDPEQIEANRARRAYMDIQNRRNELALRVENIGLKIAAASADLAKAECAKAAAEERLRSLRDAERELAELAAPPVAEADPVEVEPPPPVEAKRGPGRPKKASA